MAETYSVVTVEYDPVRCRAEIALSTRSESVDAEVAILHEREAAIREILQVISASRTDALPVFDTILKNAVRLSGAPLANLCILNDKRSHWKLVAHQGEGLRHLVVGKSTRLSNSNLVPAVSMRTASIVHVENLVETDLYQQGDPDRVAMVEEEGMRTILGVPLLLEGEAIGCITLFRREVKGFTQDEIELIETFAAQAVIAIENVRQFREVQDRLERETAIKNILGIISRSRSDEGPVFDEIVKCARKLCHAEIAGLLLGRHDEKRLFLMALNFADPSLMADAQNIVERINQTQMQMDPTVHVSAQAIMSDKVVHIHDLAQSESYLAGEPTFVAMVDEQGIRTILSVPLRDESGPIGVINLHRDRIRPFTGDEIALAGAFAAQAVIAIANVRQFREVQERLKREQASREVLEIISLNPDDEQPVFDAIINRAAKLCRAPHAGLLLRSTDDRHLLLAAANTEQSGYVDFLRANPYAMEDDTSLSVEAVRSMEVRQYPDIEALADGTAVSEQLKNTWKLERMRTLLYVPLIKGDRRDRRDRSLSTSR